MLRMDSLEAEKRRMQTRLDELEANDSTTTSENPVESAK